MENILTNFGDETFQNLASFGYTRDDIAWIGCKDFTVDENWFWTLADNSDYYAGYGRPNMPDDIKIVMKDGNWFERAEYDGSEWWRFIRVPQKPQESRMFNTDSFCAEFEPDDWAPSLYEYCDPKEDDNEMS